MSAYYDLYQTPDPLGENRNETRLHARILPRGTISADKFRELVAKATGFSPAILDGTLQAVTDELYSWLSEGLDGGSGRVGLFLRIAEMRPSGYRQERNPFAVGTFSECEPASREQIP